MVRSALSSVRYVARLAACPHFPKHTLREPNCLEALFTLALCEGADERIEVSPSLSGISIIGKIRENSTE